MITKMIKLFMIKIKTMKIDLKNDQVISKLIKEIQLKKNKDEIVKLIQKRFKILNPQKTQLK